MSTRNWTLTFWAVIVNEALVNATRKLSRATNLVSPKRAERARLTVPLTRNTS